MLECTEKFIKGLKNVAEELTPRARGFAIVFSCTSNYASNTYLRACLVKVRVELFGFLAYAEDLSDSSLW